MYAVLAALTCLPARAEVPAADTVQGWVSTVDQRQEDNGDYFATVYLEQRDPSGHVRVLELEVYRRQAGGKLAMVFTRPSTEAGTAYLRVDGNLLLYDAVAGSWERLTERDRIAGTDTVRQDFDRSRLAVEYTASFVADEKLGALSVHHLHLVQRPGVDVTWPTVDLWIDAASGNLAKRQDFAASGRLLRTTYYPAWEARHSDSKGGDVYLPKEIRIYDEVETGRNTTVVLRQVDLRPLDDSTFTKAWLESKSR